MEIFKKLPYDIQENIYKIHNTKYEYDKVIKELEGVIGDAVNYFGIKLYFYDDEIDDIMNGKSELGIGESLILFLKDDDCEVDFYDE